MDKVVYIVTGGILTPNLVSKIDIIAIIIGVDSAIEILLKNNIIPSYMIGDFDSTDPNLFSEIKEKYSERIKLSPAEKDETDTELAIRLAIELQPTKIIILGAIGTRLDHVIANIHLLIQSEQRNIETIIEGTNNRIQLLFPSKIKELKKNSFKYVSLLPFAGVVTGINLVGFKYPLVNATLKPGYPIGVSNELYEENGTISIESGILMIIESKD